MKFDDAAPDEYSFVFDSWARSFQKSPWAGCIPNHLYPQVSRAVSSEIVDRGARVLVAFVELPEGGRRIMGYSVSEPDKRVLHWLFVKKDYRSMGIGRALLAETCPDGEWEYTFRTRASSKFLGERFKHEPVTARVKG
jgi:GNAT superfamily N-acetyltransferase